MDWWEWGPEALAEANRRGVPMLLSVGYAACHWCHVMAHESFENPATAAVMNELYVNIKVDREERPDVDAVYMEYVQAMTGHGGWPMTAFLTPSGEVFYAGTYFPPTPRHGMPSFEQVLRAVSAAWSERPEEAKAAASRITGVLAQRTSASPGVGSESGAGEPLTAERLAGAVRSVSATYDSRDGGFGDAPKFPPSMVLEWLLRHHARTGSARALELAEGTLEAMARGGIYDQLAGGFARYSVDAGWVVPHFEKMLYDNALLLRVYVHWWRSTGRPMAQRIVEETAQFLLDELRTPEGGFASALDADTDGEEGLTYVWTREQLAEVLGEDTGTWAADLLSVTVHGTFEAGASTLQLTSDPGDDSRWSAARQSLLTARRLRPQPGRDDKVVSAWNGLAIAALAEAGAVFERPEWIDAATICAELVWDLHVALDGGEARLARVSREGRVGRHAGVLEDYGDVAEGFLALYGASADARWVERAGALLDVVRTRFQDGDGGFYDTSDDAEALVRRPRDATDNATPSGGSAAAGALLSYAALTGSAEHRDMAGRALAGWAELGASHPRFAGWSLAVAEAWADGPREVAIVGEEADPATTALRLAASRSPAPGAVVAVGEPGSADPRVGLLEHRPLVDGTATAYVCRHFVCAAPVTSAEALVTAMSGLWPDGQGGAEQIE